MSFKYNEYKPFGEWKWRSFGGGPVVSVDEFVENHASDGFFIGTDSQNYSKRKKLCIFTTVLIAYRMGKGGTILTHVDKTRHKDSLRHRLLEEAMRSLEVAWYLDQKIPSESIITIHLDVNSNLKYESAHYREELVGLVASQGFNAMTKPYSWAASTVADARC